MHISYLALNAPSHAAGVSDRVILASLPLAYASGYDRRSQRRWSTGGFLLRAKIRIP